MTATATATGQHKTWVQKADDEEERQGRAEWSLCWWIAIYVHSSWSSYLSISQRLWVNKSLPAVTASIQCHFCCWAKSTYVHWLVFTAPLFTEKLLSKLLQKTPFFAYLHKAQCAAKIHTDQSYWWYNIIVFINSLNIFLFSYFVFI